LSRKFVFTLAFAGVLLFLGLNDLVFVLRMDDPDSPLMLPLTIDKDGVTPTEFRNLSLPFPCRRVSGRSCWLSSDRKVGVRSRDLSRAVRPGSPPEGGARIAFTVRQDKRFEFFDARTDERLDTVSVELEE
jgi:hypothetical protein